MKCWKDLKKSITSKKENEYIRMILVPADPDQNIRNAAERSTD
jgi:hypothetical protein